MSHEQLLYKMVCDWQEIEKASRQAHNDGLEETTESTNTASERLLQEFPLSAYRDTPQSLLQ